MHLLKKFITINFSVKMWLGLNILALLNWNWNLTLSVELWNISSQELQYLSFKLSVRLTLEFDNCTAHIEPKTSQTVWDIYLKDGKPTFPIWITSWLWHDNQTLEASYRKKIAMNKNVSNQGECCYIKIWQKLLQSTKKSFIKICTTS